MVTVAADSCVSANTASTASVVWGEEAPFRLAQLGLPARFVRPDGEILAVGPWPTTADDRRAPIDGLTGDPVPDHRALAPTPGG